VALYNPLPRQLPRLFSEPAIFFGADVTHPHPMDDKSPSIAAIVASMNWPAANKYVARMRTQAHRKEIIEGLGEMVGELLEDYKEITLSATFPNFLKMGSSNDVLRS
jgi:eukaryotic translation initiation factor 2C